MIIDNETIAEGLVGSSLQIRALFGGLVRKATTIYVKEGLNVGSYVTSNFTLSAISDGYSIYIK